MRRPLFALVCLPYLACEVPPQIVADPFERLPDPDLSRLLVFREDQLREVELVATASELTAMLAHANHRGQGQGLRERASVFDPDDRSLSVAFAPGTSVEAIAAHVNASAAQLPEPRTFSVEDVSWQLSGVDGTTLILGSSRRGGDGQLAWNWTLFDPRQLPSAEALATFVRLTSRAVEPTLTDAFLDENAPTQEALSLRLDAWASSSKRALFLDGVERLRDRAPGERLSEILPPFAAETVNRWQTLPSVNCMQTANLILYPRLNRYPLFYFDPLLYMGDVGQTPWRPAMEEAGLPDQVFEVNDTISWVHDQVGATGDTDLFDLGAPLQTGTVVVMGTVAFNGFTNIGHAFTILGAIVEGDGEGRRVRDYLVIEKENPGLLPVRMERLTRVLARLEALGGAYGPDGHIQSFAYTPEGDPLPFAEVDAALLHPDA